MIQNHHGVFRTHIYYAKVLRKADLYWACTNEEVAIKRVSWKCIQACRNRISEDFIKEISALQYLAQWRAAKEMSITDIHVMTADTVMCDESYLYIVMPFCRGGDLCQRVAEVDKFSEDESRFWFRQILKVSYCLLLCNFQVKLKALTIFDLRGLKHCKWPKFVTEICRQKTL